jgi:hypothetical protein
MLHLAFKSIARHKCVYVSVDWCWEIHKISKRNHSNSCISRFSFILTATNAFYVPNTRVMSQTFQIMSHILHSVTLNKPFTFSTCIYTSTFFQNFYPSHTGEILIILFHMHWHPSWNMPNHVHSFRTSITYSTISNKEMLVIFLQRFENFEWNFKRDCRFHIKISSSNDFQNNPLEFNLTWGIFIYQTGQDFRAPSPNTLPIEPTPSIG